MNIEEAVGKLSPALREELDGLLGSLPSVVGSFREYVDAVRPGYVWYRHCEVLAGVLQRVADGELKRVMVFMPPRHGKSELVSRLFTGYFLRKNPEKFVGLVSYASELAFSLSRNARSFYGSQAEISETAAAVKQWETGQGGGLWASGVGGGQTGKGVDLGVIDDPIKNAEEAMSRQISDRNEDWWDSTFYTRQEPGAALVVIQTRWPPRDMSSYLLESGEAWTIVDFPALFEEEEERFYPENCTVLPDWRKEGEALCPERFDEGALGKIRDTIGEFYFSALYQQRPRPREGGMFKRTWFVERAVPNWADGRIVRSWDRASTKDGDYTVGVKMQRTKAGQTWILDVVRGRWSPGERDRVIKDVAVGDGRHVTQLTEQEPGSGGVDSVHAFRTMLEGYTTKGIRPSKDKVVRAGPLASIAETRGVFLASGPWNAVFIDELAGFDKAKYDDQVDATSQAYNFLTGGAVRPVVSVTLFDGPSAWG